MDFANADEAVQCGSDHGRLKQDEVRIPIAELIRKVCISEQMFYRWKAQYFGLEEDEVRQMMQLRDKNTRLKKMVAELTPDKTMLQDMPRKSCKALPTFTQPQCCCW